MNTKEAVNISSRIDLTISVSLSDQENVGLNSEGH
jgi:hypothetical protein